MNPRLAVWIVNGLLAGLAAMSLIGLTRLTSWEAARGTRFYVDPHTDTVYEAPR